MRTWRWIFLAVAAAAVGAAFFFRGGIAVMAMKRVAPRAITADMVATLPDGLHVALCGTGSPLPDPRRSGPCTAIIAGPRVFIVDAGDGAARMTARMRLPAARLEGVFITHFHSDHIDGLGALALMRWAGGGGTAPLPVRGPSGVERVVAGFNEAYAQDAAYRIAHHGADIVVPGGAGMTAQPFAIPDGADQAVVFNDGGLRVMAFRVDHEPVAPAVGYRFDYGGRSVVVSGDTSRAPALEAAAQGVDLLVHEALGPNLVALMEDSARQAGREKLAKIFKDIPDYHASPADAAASARAAGVKALLLTHIVPVMPTPALEPVFLKGADFGGKLWIGRDGDLVSLPSGSGDITKRNVL
ncbi:MAG: MBL fold metallo-hydrolase [Hyphomonadaceae bacterium]|nr:MBL fold metallo-hydrolase [Hyphomonadaceae bacterium]